MEDSENVLTTETFPRKSTRGVIYGFNLTQAILLGIGIVSVLICLLTQDISKSHVIGLIIWNCILIILGFVKIQNRYLIYWIPIILHFVWRKKNKQDKFYMRLAKPRPAGNLAIPGDSASIKLYTANSYDDLSLVYDPHAKTMTIIGAISYSEFVLLDSGEQEQQSFAFAKMLSAITKIQGVTRLQLLERCIPDNGYDARKWWDSFEHGNSFAKEQYEKLLSQISVAATKHQSYIAIQISQAKAASLVKDNGGGIAGLAKVTQNLIFSIENALQKCNVRVEKWLTGKDIIALCRSTLDPSQASQIEQDPTYSRDIENSGVVTVEEHWEYVRADSGFFQIWVIKKHSQLPKFPGFLQPFLLSPDIKTIFSMTFNAIASDKALNAAKKEVVSEASAYQERINRGKVDTVINQEERAQAEKKLGEVATGWTDLEHAITVVVQADNIENLKHQSAQLQQVAEDAEIQLRLAYGQQALLLVKTTLPFCRAF